MATLKIDLGLKSFEVCDTDGNTLGTIRFNPSDPGLLPGKAAEKRVRELASTPEGEYDTADGLAMLDREVKAQIDHAFGTPVSEVFFQQVSSRALRSARTAAWYSTTFCRLLNLLFWRHRKLHRPTAKPALKRIPENTRVRPSALRPNSGERVEPAHDRDC